MIGKNVSVKLASEGFPTDSQRFDLIFAACGYESRARHTVEASGAVSSNAYALAYQDSQELSFDDNRQFFEKHGFKVPVVTDSDARLIAANALRQHVSGRTRVLFDVSSMPRRRIATILHAVFDHARRGNLVDLTLGYSIAKYSAPHASASVIKSIEPVIPELAGWTDSPELPLSVIFGLGYEPDKVLGVNEFLEPSTSWLFVPHGVDPQFLTTVEASNRILIDSSPKRRLIEYSVAGTFDAFSKIESLAFGILRDSRPIVVPFGPKLFAAISIVVAEIHFPDVGVWNATSGTLAIPHNVEAEGDLMGLTVEIVGIDNE